jgi:transcriptional regulator with XRE-family HTH domain
MTMSFGSYGRFIRDVRRSSGLTQAQVAATTGISQPNLSAYETGRRMPSIDALNRIIVACGFQLVAEAGSRSVRCPLPAAGWFPDEDVPPPLPDDPAGSPSPVPVGLSQAARGRLVREALALGDAQS